MRAGERWMENACTQIEMNNRQWCRVSIDESKCEKEAENSTISTAAQWAARRCCCYCHCCSCISSSQQILRALCFNEARRRWKRDEINENFFSTIFFSALGTFWERQRFFILAFAYIWISAPLNINAWFSFFARHSLICRLFFSLLFIFIVFFFSFFFFFVFLFLHRMWHTVVASLLLLMLLLPTLLLYWST